jgi:phage shock protein A
MSATLAALDEALLVPVPSAPEWLQECLKQTGDSPTTLAALEREADYLMYHATPLQSAAALERRAVSNWEKRELMAVGQQRDDFARQAAKRADSHRRRAKEIEAELNEYVALETQFRDAITVLRGRVAQA